MKKRNLIPRVGDTIPYVICTTNENGDTGSSESYAKRAFHPDDIIQHPEERQIG
jgi:hypothetical protein